MVSYKSIQGKTYSLFGKAESTRPFYEKISALTDKMLDELSCNEKQLVDYIQFISRTKSGLKKATKKNPGDSRLSDILQKFVSNLAEHTPGVEQHLKSTPLYKHITDKRLLTSREQYYFYMIEFELISGMRLCMKAGLPVIGTPLNANRCPRWTDGFYENSVDLQRLDMLLHRQ